MTSSSATVNQPHAAPSNACVGRRPRLESAAFPPPPQVDAGGTGADVANQCKPFKLPPAPRRPTPAEQSGTAKNEVTLPGLPNDKLSSTMVTGHVARRRKSAKAKSQSAKFSRNLKPRRRGTFSEKMVISSDIPAAVTTRRNLAEILQVSPTRNPFDLSDYVDDGQDGRLRQALTIRNSTLTPLPRTPLHSDSAKGGPSNVTGDAFRYVPLSSDSWFESEQGKLWPYKYAGAAPPSSSDSEKNVISMNEYEASEDSLKSESHVEIFPHLRRHLQQELVVNGDTFSEAKACSPTLVRTQIVSELMKRLDLLFTTVGTGSSTESDHIKATISLPSASCDLGSSIVSNSHSPFEELAQFSCKYPGEDYYWEPDISQRTTDHEILRLENNSGSDQLTKYHITNADIFGPSQHSLSEEWEKDRASFLFELLRASQLQDHDHLSCHIQISDGFPPSPTMSTCTRLSSCKHPRSSPSSTATDDCSSLIWEQENDRGFSCPDLESLRKTTTCINDGFTVHPSLSDSKENINTTSSERFLEIKCMAAAEDEDYSSATTSQQTEGAATHDQPVHNFLDGWDNCIQHARSPNNDAPDLFKNCAESPDDHLSLMINSTSNESIPSALQRTPSHLYPAHMDEEEEYWDTMPVGTDYRPTTLSGSDDLEILQRKQASEFLALQGLNVCAQEYEGEEKPEAFHDHHQSSHPASRRNSINGFASKASSPEWANDYWMSSMAVDHGITASPVVANFQLIDNLLDDCSVSAAEINPGQGMFWIDPQS